MSTQQTGDDSSRPTILHDVSDDSKFVEITSSPFSTERLLEGDLNVGDEIFVEGRVEHDVGESEDEEILDHFLSEIMIDSEDLLRLS